MRFLRIFQIRGIHLSPEFSFSRFRVLHQLQCFQKKFGYNKTGHTEIVKRSAVCLTKYTLDKISHK
jgi:hypothetical protein